MSAATKKRSPEHGKHGKPLLSRSAQREIIQVIHDRARAGDVASAKLYFQMTGLLPVADEIPDAAAV
jgi:hypothetical protein